MGLLKALLVSRPIFWLIAPAAYLFGVYAGGSSFSELVAIQAALLTVPLGIYVFGINDLFDMESDRANPRRKGDVWGARVEEKDAKWILPCAAMAILALLASAAFSGSPLQFLVTLLFLPFPYLYSAPPFRLKSRPVLDSLTNATYTYGPFAMGYALSGSMGFLDPNMILFALVFSAAHAIGTIMDIEGDSKAGIRTFALAYGSRAAALFACAILLANLPFAYSTMKSMFAVILIYLFASLYVLWKPTPQNAKGAFIAMNLSITAWFLLSAGSFFGFWPLF